MAQERSANPQSEREAGEQIHEQRDLKLKLVAGFVVAITLAAFVIHGALWGWFEELGGKASPASNLAWQVLAPDSSAAQRGFPALQLNPQRDLRDYKRDVDRRLRSYAWIDPERQVIQLPVARAIQLVAQKGLPEWRRGGGPPEFQNSTNSANSNDSVDAAFLKRMAQASIGAIQLGRLAETNSQVSELSDIGQKLADEHRDLLKDIQDAAKSAGATLPRKPGLRDQVAERNLRQKQATEFDQELAKQLVADTSESLEELRESTNELETARVKNLASHLEEKLETEMQDVREAARAAGVSEGMILEIIQRQQSAARMAAASRRGQYPSPQRKQSGEEQNQKENSEQTGSSAPQSKPQGSGQEKGSSEGGNHSSGAGSIDLDTAFLNRLAHAAAAEQRLGSIGAKRAQNQRLADLSRKLAQDQQRLNSELSGPARSFDVNLPQQPELEEQLRLNHLQRSTDKDFDRELAGAIIEETATLLQEVENASSKLQDSQLTQLARKTESNLKSRLNEAKKAAQAVGIEPKEIERVIVTELMAAGAPFPLMVSAQSGESSGEQGKSENGAQRAAEGSGGSQESGSGMGGSSTDSSASESRRTPAPLQLQQQQSPQQPKPKK